jgi:hypothetical protein
MLYQALFWASSVAFHIAMMLFTFNKGISIGLHYQKPLYDVIQQHTFNLRRYRIIPEILHFIPIAMLGFYTLYSFYISNKDFKSEWYFAFKTFFTKHGILFYLRPLLFSSTLLPDSSQLCLTSQSIGSCFDLIFSGHSSIMFLTTYLLRDIFNIGAVLFYTLQFNNLLTSFLIIACRNHYTVDVLLAIIITHFVYFYGQEFRLGI